MYIYIYMYRLYVSICLFTYLQAKGWMDLAVFMTLACCQLEPTGSPPNGLSNRDSGSRLGVQGCWVRIRRFIRLGPCRAGEPGRQAHGTRRQRLLWVGPEKMHLNCRCPRILKMHLGHSRLWRIRAKSKSIAARILYQQGLSAQTWQIHRTANPQALVEQPFRTCT